MGLLQTIKACLGTAVAPLEGEAEAGVLPAGDGGAACGWFDSSHDLLRGLGVVEHAGFDAVADDVPLGWQLAALC